MTSEEIHAQVWEMGKQARAAAHELTKLSTEQKNEILVAMADAVIAAESEILSANEKDLAAADENGLTDAMKDRLRLDHDRIAAMADGIREVAELHDPSGEILREWTRPNGLQIRKQRTPIGVIGIIYEETRQLNLTTPVFRHLKQRLSRRQKPIGGRLCHARIRHQNPNQTCPNQPHRPCPFLVPHCGVWSKVLKIPLPLAPRAVSRGHGTDRFPFRHPSLPRCPL